MVNKGIIIAVVMVVIITIAVVVGLTVYFVLKNKNAEEETTGITLPKPPPPGTGGENGNTENSEDGSTPAPTPTPPVVQPTPPGQPSGTTPPVTTPEVKYTTVNVDGKSYVKQTFYDKQIYLPSKSIYLTTNSGQVVVTKVKPTNGGWNYDGVHIVKNDVSIGVYNSGILTLLNASGNSEWFYDGYSIYLFNYFSKGEAIWSYTLSAKAVMYARTGTGFQNYVNKSTIPDGWVVIA
jgi:hypothetical protein